MSGGSLNYLYGEVERAADSIVDPELNKLVRDMAELLHDFEWFLDGDISEGAYNKTVLEFKEKWLKRPDTIQTREMVAAELDNTTKTIYKMLGIEKMCKDCKHWVREKEGSDYGRCKDHKWLTHGYEWDCGEWE